MAAAIALLFEYREETENVGVRRVATMRIPSPQVETVVTVEGYGITLPEFVSVSGVVLRTYLINARNA